MKISALPDNLPMEGPLYTKKCLRICQLSKEKKMTIILNREQRPELQIDSLRKSLTSRSSNKTVWISKKVVPLHFYLEIINQITKLKTTKSIFKFYKTWRMKQKHSQSIICGLMLLVMYYLLILTFQNYLLEKFDVNPMFIPTVLFFLPEKERSAHLIGKFDKETIKMHE